MQNTRELTKGWKFLFIIIVSIAIIMSIDQIFHLRFLGFVELNNTYLYFLLAAFMSTVFLVYRSSKKEPQSHKVPWYDIVLFLFSFTFTVYIGINGMNIAMQAWEYNPPTYAVIPAVLFWILLIEAVRRVSGNILAVVVSLFSLYPIISPFLPGFLEGQGRSFTETASFHVFGTQSIIGIPMGIFGNLIIGFIIFGVVMVWTGAGKFFMDLATAILGSTRGGAAKMSVLASALFGSLSGSPISNVLTTGVVTVPLMKKTGYEKHKAGGIEACASTGGVMMPPIMGATAFIMASMLGVPYLYVVIVAIVPSFLYFLSLLLQVDLYAAKNDIKGIPRDETPNLYQTLKKGWPYIIAFLILLYFLLILRWEAQAPYITSAVLIVLAQFKKDTRFNFEKFTSFLERSGKVLIELVVILAGVGFVIGSLSFTGLAQALSSELVSLAGGQLIPLLLMGALTAFILGMGVTITAVYVFLAVVLAPALTNLGIPPLAAHLYILYWGMLSNITPPVALAAFAASSVAESKPMRTANEAMKTGVVIYFLPFFFVLNSTMIMVDVTSWIEFTQILITVVLGVIIMTFAVTGYIYKIGNINVINNYISLFVRFLLFVGGVLMAFPEGTSSYIQGNLPLWGAFLVIVVMCTIIYSNKRNSRLGGDVNVKADT